MLDIWGGWEEGMSVKSLRTAGITIILIHFSTHIGLSWADPGILHSAGEKQG